MRKVRLTEKMLRYIKRTEDDIYNMYTTEEVLSMTDVSEDEKQTIGLFDLGTIGWVEDVESEEYNKIFVQIYEIDILEVICDKKPTRSLV